MFEVVIRIKGEDQTLNRKFLSYDKEVKLNEDDKVLRKMVEDTLKDFNGNVEDVQVKIKMTW